MYTECTIQFIDDGTVFENQIIKADEEIDEIYDDLIFFYGLTRKALLELELTGEAVNNEWKVLSVGSSFDIIC